MGRNINDLPAKAQATKRAAIARAEVVRAQVAKRLREEAAKDE